MANYYPFARSNYFMVKDAGAFAGFCKKWNVELIRGGDGDTLFGFLCPEAEEGIPLSVYDEAKDEYVDGDFIADLATHLADGWVAIVREIGYEKLRYLVGYTVAVNSQGTKRSVDLNEIYRKARKLGEHVTDCEY